MFSNVACKGPVVCVDSALEVDENAFTYQFSPQTVVRSIAERRW